MGSCAVLLGYGVYDGSNPAYKTYIDGFAEFVNSHDVSRIVLCGGATDPARPGLSEAASMYSHLKPMLGKQVETVLEEASLTSFQNLDFSRPSVDMGSDVHLFCGNAKLPKVMWYAMHYWFGMKRGEISREMLRYMRGYDSRHFTTEQVGSMLSKGVTFRNVSFVPFEMWTDTGDLLGNMMSTLIEVELLYDRDLMDEFLEHVKTKFGLESPARTGHL